VWLAPEQVRVLPITDEVKDVAASYVEKLRDAGIRASLDDRTETLNYKIREAETQKVPYMAVVGKREAEAGSVAVRRQGAGQKQEVMALPDFIVKVTAEITSKALI
jgi:threonyl-tRNA synthetase